MGKEYEKQLLSFILLHVIPHLELYFLKFQYNDAEIPYLVRENRHLDFSWKHQQRSAAVGIFERRRGVQRDAPSGRLVEIEFPRINRRLHAFAQGRGLERAAFADGHRRLVKRTRSRGIRAVERVTDRRTALCGERSSPWRRPT